MRSFRLTPRALSAIFHPPVALALALTTAVAFGGTPACVSTSGVEPSTDPEVNPEPSTPDDGGTPTPDAGVPEQDAGPAPEDAGIPVDAGPTDGGAPEVDAGNPEPDPPGPCAIADPCNDVAASATVTFTPGAAPSFTVGANTFTIGVSTRQEIATALGTTVDDATNPFRAFACGPRLDLRFVDDLDGDDFEGTSSANDVLARVLTMSGTQVTSTSGVSLDSNRSAALAAMNAPASHSGQGFDFDFDFPAGFGVRSVGSDVEGMSLFLPQAGDHIAMTFDALSNSLTDASGTVDTNVSRNQAAGILGDAYDVDGIVQRAQLNSRVYARIYSAIGIRLGDICPLNNCSDLDTIVLSSPFLGVDANGLGLGSTRTEIEAVYGAVDRYSGNEPNDDDKLHVYRPDPNDNNQEIGIVFVNDEDCVRRAAAFVLPFIEAN